uniref:TPX2 domain-containing protein n=1 Tax=Angiostrongylus cantonensis TaxID=6313 RepID=A0A158PB97_ANGCA
MASSRGKERLKERQNSARYFVFGSSTPRDLSHMNKIPPKFRSYDAKLRVHREGPELKEYMEKARSLTRNDSAETRHWAFGSSTPRDLAHMTAISTAQRVYDAKSPKKSTTSPEFTTPVRKRSTTAPQPIHRVAAPSRPKPFEEDAASEPDFVQDREELLSELRKKKVTMTSDKKKVDKKTNGKGSRDTSKTRAEPKKTKIDETPRFTHAPELPAEVRTTERIPQNLHEEESVTVRGNTTRGLNDQIIVSELTEERKDKEIVLDKDGEQKLDKNVEDKAKDILKKVEDVSANTTANIKDFAKDMKAAVEDIVAQKESITKEVEKVLDNTNDVAMKKADPLISGASDLVTRIDSTLSGDVSKTENAVKSAQPENLEELKGENNSSHEAKESTQLIISDMSTKT